MTEQKRTWGGRRTAGPGKRIGRPFVDPAQIDLERTCVTLPKWMIESIEGVGEGNLSEGIRRMYAGYNELTGSNLATGALPRAQSDGGDSGLGAE